MFGNEEIHPFLEMPKLILTFIQTFKAKIYEKMKQKAYCHQANILAEKTTSGILCVFKSFQYMIKNEFVNGCLGR